MILLDKESIRYERKFIIDGNFSSLETVPKLEFLNLRKLYPERIVNSIYYDTHNLEFANQSIEGLNIRNKVRIRYYGNYKTNDIFLEIKSKHGELGKKHILKIDKNRFIEGDLGLSHLFLNNLIPQQIINNLYSLKPVIFISYRRNYYISKSENFRLTFDKDILFSLMDSYSNWNSIGSCIKQRFNNNIIELKFPPGKEFSVRKITSKLPFRLNSCSKYCFGLSKLGLISI